MSLIKAAHKRKTAKEAAIEALQKKETKQLNILLDEEKHISFKTKAARENKGMTQLINKWIDAYLSE